MSTSISKNINHPPSGFNPHAPDPASECIVIRGRSISAQSYSPAKNLKMWKPHWWSAFLGTQKTLSCCFFIVFFLSFFKNDEQMWVSEGLEGKKRNSSSYRSLISWSDIILREISTFSSEFLKRYPATQPDWHQPVRDKLGHPGASLRSIYIRNGKPQQQTFALPLVSILRFCALLAVKVGTKKVSVCV